MQGDPMKQVFRRGVAKAGDYAKARPEAFWSIIGTTAGATAGLFVGGVGIAAGGGAIGVSGLFVLLILAVVAGLAGNRLGIEIDRRTARK
jgi:hypothetical protein